MNTDEILSVGSRRRIYDFVERQPGAHLREIARSLELPLGTALYHLDYLKARDLVVVKRDGRYKRFFVRHLLGRREKDYISAFHHRVPREIAEALLARGEGTQKELCDELGVSRSTLSFHASNLVAQGILTCEEGGPENRYAVAEPELATRVLESYWGAGTPEAAVDGEPASAGFAPLPAFASGGAPELSPQ